MDPIAFDDNVDASNKSHHEVHLEESADKERDYASQDRNEREIMKNIDIDTDCETNGENMATNDSTRSKKKWMVAILIVFVFLVVIGVTIGVPTTEKQIEESNDQNQDALLSDRNDEHNTSSTDIPTASPTELLTTADWTNDEQVANSTDIPTATPTELLTTADSTDVTSNYTTSNETTSDATIPYTYLSMDALDQREDSYFGDPSDIALTDGSTEDTSHGSIVAWESSSESDQSTHPVILDLNTTAELSWLDVYGVVKSEIGLHAPLSIRAKLWAGRNLYVGYAVGEIHDADDEGPWMQSFSISSQGNGMAATRITLDIRCPTLDPRAVAIAVRRCGITEITIF